MTQPTKPEYVVYTMLPDDTRKFYYVGSPHGDIQWSCEGSVKRFKRLSDANKFAAQHGGTVEAWNGLKLPRRKAIPKVKVDDIPLDKALLKLKKASKAAKSISPRLSELLDE